MKGRGKKATKGGGSRSKLAGKIAVDDKSLEVIADPWIGLRSPLGGKLSPAEEWRRLRDAASQGRELVLAAETSRAVLQAPTPEAFRKALRIAAKEQFRDNTIGDVNDGEGETTVLLPDDRTPVERLVILRQDVPLVATACARSLLTTGLIRLDVGGLELGDAGLDTMVAWTPWLRELSAAGNKLTRVPLLRGLRKLQLLNLASNGIRSLSAGCFPPELGSTLRNLNLGGNRLGQLVFPATPAEGARELEQRKQEDRPQAQRDRQPSLACVMAGSSAKSPFHALTSLVDLNLANNALDAHGVGLSQEVFTKLGFPRLVELDLRGNNLTGEEEGQLSHQIITGVPTLRILNGREVSRETMKVSSIGPMFELLSTGKQSRADHRQRASVGMSLCEHLALPTSRVVKQRPQESGKRRNVPDVHKTVGKRLTRDWRLGSTSPTASNHPLLALRGRQILYCSTGPTPI